MHNHSADTFPFYLNLLVFLLKIPKSVDLILKSVLPLIELDGLNAVNGLRCQLSSLLGKLLSFFSIDFGHLIDVVLNSHGDGSQYSSGEEREADNTVQVVEGDYQLDWDLRNFNVFSC
jgi:hypothetical protein